MNDYTISGNIAATKNLGLCLNWLMETGVEAITYAAVDAGNPKVMLDEAGFEKASAAFPGVVCRSPHGGRDLLYVDGVFGCRVFSLTKKRTALLVVKEAA